MWSSRPSKQFKLSGRVWQKLEGYQQEAVQKSLQVKTCALFMEQGTGKTWVAGGIVEQLVAPLFCGVIVVGLNNIDTTWYSFFKEHLPQVKLCKSWDHFRVAACPKVWVIHYEGLNRYVPKLRKMALSLIVYDESQRLKARGTRQSRDAAKLRNCAEFKMILSGTPIEEQPIDLWAQFRFLNPSILGDKWKHFSQEYMTDPIDFNKYRPGTFAFRKAMASGEIETPKFDFDKLPQLIEAVAPYSIRVGSEVLGLKTLSVIPTPVAMFGDQRRFYEELESSMAIDHPKLKVTAPLRITQIGKLQQICGGFVFDDEDQLFYLGKAKLRKTKVLVRKRTGPCVIFCKYRPEIDLLHRELSKDYKVALITGQVKRRDRAKIIRDFQAGKVGVIICQVRTGGTGIDLFRSNYVICYSITHSQIDFSQLKKRVHRRGQKRAVKLFLLYVPGTIDEDIVTGIWRKDRLTSRVLTQLMKRRQSNGQRRKDKGIGHRRYGKASRLLGVHGS